MHELVTIDTDFIHARFNYETDQLHVSAEIYSHCHTSLASCPLKMGPTGCVETSLLNYLSTLPNIPEQLRILHTAHYENERIKHIYVFVIRLIMAIYFSRKL